uniref:Uncharacterized protein n=1 Tax=Spongospora subterranea TaxID=70186 RepID=A0A0H5RJR8_9EUKA|eukprot:CRZ08954.1 hypothetical protein [Spongospora subterranea]
MLSWNRVLIVVVVLTYAVDGGLVKVQSDAAKYVKQSAKRVLNPTVVKVCIYSKNKDLLFDVGQTRYHLRLAERANDDLGLSDLSSQEPGSTDNRIDCKFVLSFTDNKQMHLVQGDNVVPIACQVDGGDFQCTGVGPVSDSLYTPIANAVRTKLIQQNLLVDTINNAVFKSNMHSADGQALKQYIDDCERHDNQLNQSDAGFANFVPDEQVPNSTFGDTLVEQGEDALSTLPLGSALSSNDEWEYIDAAEQNQTLVEQGEDSLSAVRLGLPLTSHIEWEFIEAAEQNQSSQDE